MNQTNRTGYVNMNPEVSDINRNLNRGNTTSDYEEIVNTTMNSNNEIDNHAFDNFSVVTSGNNQNFNFQNSLKKNPNLVSSDNLIEVNKIYATKEPNKKPEDLVEELKATEEDEEINPDNKIYKYMQLKSFEIKGDDTVFCLSVDGSQHSEYAFEVTLQDLMKENDKLLIVNIFNSAMDESFNFRNRKDTIIDNYSTKILRIDKSKVLFLKEDKVSNLHLLEQVNRISANHKCSYLISGYYGMKGPRGDNKELSKGIDYLLSFSKTPTIIIKEANLRKNKPKKQINWLFVFDRAFMNCYSTVQKFSQLIDPKNDLVYGFGLLPTWITFDDVKKNFLLDMQILGLKNLEYETAEYKKNPSELVKEKVNFGDIHFDYLVFYNNPEKYRSEGQFSDIINIVTKCASNICFVNGL